MMVHTYTYATITYNYSCFSRETIEWNKTECGNNKYNNDYTNKIIWSGQWSVWHIFLKTEDWPNLINLHDWRFEHPVFKIWRSEDSIIFYFSPQYLIKDWKTACLNSGDSKYALCVRSPSQTTFHVEVGPKNRTSQQHVYITI